MFLIAVPQIKAKPGSIWDGFLYFGILLTIMK